MPLCRRPLASLPSPRPGPETVRLAHYVVARRVGPRAANDNRRTRQPLVWPWAVAIAAAPTLTAALILVRLI